MRVASLLHGLMLRSSWGFGLYSSRRNLPAPAGLSDNKKRRRFSIFKLFNFYSYIIFGVGGGGGGSKNYQEIKRGDELIMLLRTGGGGARHNNFPFEAHFSAPPLLIIIAMSLSLNLL